MPVTKNSKDKCPNDKNHLDWVNAGKQLYAGKGLNYDVMNMF